MRPGVRDFMAKIRIITPDNYEADFHDVPSVKIDVELQDGAVRSAEVKRPLGHPENPMTPADYECKFRALAAPVLSERQTNMLLDRLWHLEEVQDIGNVLAMTVP